MARCNNVAFSYRGTKYDGRALAEMLSEMSIAFTTDRGSAVIADLGALIAELDNLLVRKQVEEEKEILASKSTPSILTPISPVHVRDRYVLQWLRSMNIPTGKPITVQFVDDLSSKHIPFDPDPSRDGEPVKYKIEFRSNAGSWRRSSRFPALYNEREAMRLIDEGNSADPSGWERRKVRA